MEGYAVVLCDVGSASGAAVISLKQHNSRSQWRSLDTSSVRERLRRVGRMISVQSTFRRTQIGGLDSLRESEV